MKKLFVIAALLLVQVAHAQDSIPPKKNKIEVIKNNYTKKEKKEHLIIATSIISFFVLYMAFFVKSSK